MKMVKVILIVSIVAVSFFLKTKSFSNADISLNQLALACNIVPESTDDYCWYVEYNSPVSYDCYEGGIWSCYV